MATLKLNDLQVSYAQSWAGLTTDNHLYAIYQNDVQLASDIVTQVFNKLNYQGLENFFSKYPTKVLDHDGEFSWKLKGDDRKAIAIVGYTAADSARPGYGKAAFQLELAERFFQKSDYLIFDDRNYGVRIIDEGVSNGTTWVYTVEHMKPSMTHFIPTGLLTAGRRVSKQNNIVTNVLNDEFGGTEFTSHFELRNHFSTLSKEYVVPGNMHDRPLLIGFKTPDGGMEKTWTRWQEMVYNFQWLKEKNRQLMFSESNQNSDGTFSTKAGNGFTIKQGAGLRQQISPSYRFYFSKLTLDYLYEVALNLSINILPEDQREFLILTGERGMIAFHKLIEDKVGIFQPLGDNRTYGSGQNRGFGGQYRSFMGPQGVKYTIAHMPEYDDVIDNRLDHPDGGYTENYRMTIMNIGTTNGEPNIQKIVPRGRYDLKGYVAGLTSPYGPNKGGLMSAAIDGYEMKCQTSHAIKLHNPMSAAELIPAVATQY